MPEAVHGAGRVQAWLVGPGLDTASRAAGAKAQLDAARAALAGDEPVVVDAGGLDLLDADVLAARADAVTLLTPHAGECARLLTRLGPRRGHPRATSRPGRWPTPERSAALTGATVLLKGATTLVVAAGRRSTVWSQSDAPPWLATAGAGDVLAGLLGTLLAAGLPADVAGALGALVHGVAADRANPGGPVRALAVAHGIPAAVAHLLGRGRTPGVLDSQAHDPAARLRPRPRDPRASRRGSASTSTRSATTSPSWSGGPGPRRCMAVVKGDAYGHGLVPSARAALDGGASWLGVAQLAEALELRKAGVTAPLLTWLFPPGADVGGAIDADIEVTVGSGWTLDAVAAAARERGRPARVQVKVDTGLGRGGILTDWSEMVQRVARAQAEGAIEVDRRVVALRAGPMRRSTRPCAPRQARFVEAVAELERAGVRPALRHLANSAATLTNPVGPLRHGAARAWPSTACPRCPTSATPPTSACARRCG